MIELLDVKATWAKIRSGFNSGPKAYENPAAKPTLRYGQSTTPPELSVPAPGVVFSGKTFSQRKK